MKKALFFVLFLTACTPSNLYSNDELGIQFAYSSPEFKGKLEVEDNEIIYHYPDSLDIQYIAVFQKAEGQSIEEAILALVKEKGKNPDDCTVVNEGPYWANENYTAYTLDLSQPTLVYTEEELAAIAEADAEAVVDTGPFDGEWMKGKIMNDRLIAACSDYADPLGLATFKTVTSSFIFNKKTEFVFLPSYAEPQFYDPSTLMLTH